MEMCFVCGCPRSGTTALAQMINEHPQALLGVERFKYIAMGSRGAEFKPELFEQERFIDIRDTDTNLKGANLPIAQKAASIWPPQIIGEKIPRLYMRQKYLRDTFPKSKLVAIVRDPLAVALSWQARADNPKDNWPAKNGAAQGFEEWAKSVNFIAAAAPLWKDDLIVVNYETFFGYNDMAEFKDKIKVLFSKLSLDDSDEILDHVAKALFRAPSAKKAKPVPEEYAALVETARQHDKLEKVLSRAI